jgi:hypothetical protein
VAIKRPLSQPDWLRGPHFTGDNTMPNTFEYASWLSMTCSELLESKRGVSNYFNTDWNKDFKQDFPVGDSISVPFPQQFISSRGLDYNPSAINRRHATISFEEPFQIGFEWDSAEQMLRAPRGRARVEKEILAPAMSQLAQDIDSFCAQYAYQNAASLVGILATNPTTYDATSAAARQAMQELGCPDSGDRAMIVSPAVMRSVKTGAIALFNPVTDLSKQFRKGIVGQSDGFDWYESMSLYRHTAGTTTSPTVTTTQTGTDAISSIAIGCTTGNTFKKGDKISFAAVLPVHPQTRRTFGTATKNFTVTADVTAANSTATVSFSPPMYGPGSQYQNVDALPVATAVVTMWQGTTSPNGKIGQVGLALHRNAFALVSGKLEEPKGSSVELVSQTRDPDSGVNVRFIRSWDNRASKFINVFHCILGAGVFYNDACAVAVACG